MLLGVFLGFKKDDVAFREKIPQQERVQTGEYSQSIHGMDVLTMIEHAYSGKSDPGEDQQQEAECYCFGFIVVFWKVFSHVRKNKTKTAQNRE